MGENMSCGLEIRTIAPIVNPLADASDKIAALEHVRALARSGMLLESTLLCGLRDPDESVRVRSVSVTCDIYERGSTGDRIALMENVISVILTKVALDKLDNELLLSIGQFIRYNRHREPHLFVAMLRLVQDSMFYSTDSARIYALSEFYKAAARKDDWRSTELLRSKRESSYQEILLSSESPPASINAVLRECHDLSISEIGIESAIFHINPVMTGYDYPVILQALRNLKKWSGEYRTNDLKSLPDVRAQIRSYSRNESALPSAMLIQITMNHLLTTDLVRQLTNFSSSTHYGDFVTYILDILKHFYAVRTVDRVKEICGWLINRNLDIETLRKSVLFLTNMLTSLAQWKSAEFLPKNSALKSADMMETIWKNMYVNDEHLKLKEIDRLVLDGLSRIAKNHTVPDDIKKTALRAIVSARPSDLESLLLSIVEETRNESSVIDLILNELADMNILEGYGFIKHIWDQVDIKVNEERALLIIKVLAFLGSIDCMSTLREAMEQKTSKRVSNTAREALIRSGYSLQVRLIDGKKLIEDLKSQESEAQRGLRTTERRLNELLIQHAIVQNQLRHELYEIQRMVIEKELSVAEHGVGLLRMNTDLVQSSYALRGLHSQAQLLSRDRSSNLDLEALLGDPGEDLQVSASDLQRQIERIGENIQQTYVGIEQGLKNTMEVSSSEKDKRAAAHCLLTANTIAEIRKICGEFNSGELKLWANARDDFNRRMEAVRADLSGLARRGHISNAKLASGGEFAEIIGAIERILQRIDNIRKDKEKLQITSDKQIERCDSRVTNLKSSVEKLQKEVAGIDGEKDRVSREIEEIMTKVAHLIQLRMQEEASCRKCESLATQQSDETGQLADRRAYFLVKRRQLEDLIRLQIELNMQNIFTSGAFQADYGSQLEDIRSRIERAGKVTT
jgi:hypothetical protein